MKTRPEIGYHPARVLIVDDERHNRQLLEVMLTPEGLLLQTAASGEEALSLVAQHAPDLILLDIMMPGMDGYQVVTALKSNVRTKGIPIIMVTALDDRAARMRGLTAGAEDFLTKPVDRAELCARVRNLLRLKAYGDYLDTYSQMLEREVHSRTAELIERTKQAAALAEQTALHRLVTERLSLATSVARVGVWELDLATNTFTWDATMCDIYGRAHATQVSHDQWSAAVFAEDRPVVEGAMRRAIGDKGQEAVEYRIVLPNGASRNVSAVAKSVLNDKGDVVRLVGVDMDVTERKLAEQALDTARNDQMRFKDEFLSHVSHELRSPLTAIKQFSSILLNGLAGELNSEQREYQQIVLRNIRQLESMIDDLLEITRLETGQLTVAPASVSIAYAVRDTMDTLQGAARAKGIALTFDVPSDMPSAFADPTRLQQILIILLDNAIKFTPDGGAVTIQAQLLEDNARVMRIEVRDTGCGIRPEMHERIFERLYQASTPAAGSRQGLGLGLFICKALVTRQGGHISVADHAGPGTTISFTLPVVRRC